MVATARTLRQVTAFYLGVLPGWTWKLKLMETVNGFAVTKIGLLVTAVLYTKGYKFVRRKREGSFFIAMAGETGWQTTYGGGWNRTRDLGFTRPAVYHYRHS